MKDDGFLSRTVIPAKAGTHLLMPQEMGPRFRGDDEVEGEDDFDARAAAWVATLPEAEQGQWTEIFALGRDILDSIDGCRREIRDCNVILARTNGRMEKFFHDFGDPSEAAHAR